MSRTESYGFMICVVAVTLSAAVLLFFVASEQEPVRTTRASQTTK